MERFTVYLPRHDFRLEYPYEAFTQLFPNSVITLALQQSGEKEIPLDNPKVSPDILRYLAKVLDTHTFPPTNSDLRPQLDYLSIDLPEFVYSSAYANLSLTHPEIKFLDSKDLDLNYGLIHDTIVGSDLYSLAEYLYAHTNPEDHVQQDLYLYTRLLQRDVPSTFTERLAILVYQSRSMKNIIDEEYLTNQEFVILTSGYLDLYRITGLDKIGDSVISSSTGLLTHILESLIEAIGSNPSHMDAYISVIIYARTFIQIPESSADWTYQIFHGVYMGEVKAFDKYLTDRRYNHESSIVNNPQIISGLLMLAVLQGHTEMYLYLVEKTKVWERIGSLNTSPRSIFYKSYMDHPELVTPDMLSIIDTVDQH